MGNRKDPSPKQKDSVLSEAGYRCANPVCGTIIVLDVHHIVEVSEGGGTEPANLLALCPTCHALYHRGSISRDAIHHWKSRIVAINKAGLNPTKFLHNTTSERKGFALAFSEFSWRTCPIGIINGRRFRAEGLCTFVSQSLAITTLRVANAVSLQGGESGSPRIWTKLGMAKFTVRSTYHETAIVEMGTIDDKRAKESLRQSPNLANFLSPPLQTAVRYRMVPFVGETVGVIHLPRSTEELRGARDYQFEMNSVAFMNRVSESERDFLYTLGPMLTAVKDEGAPVFASDCRFLGLVSRIRQVDGELGWRPEVTNLLGLRAILPEDN